MCVVILDPEQRVQLEKKEQQETRQDKSRSEFQEGLRGPYS